MTPAKEGFTKLFATGSAFYVPFYQRAYVWNEKLWSRFLRDMEKVSSSNEEYFMGSIILKKTEEGSEGLETSQWYIVDGQQRMTTLALFYKVFSLKAEKYHHLFDQFFRISGGSDLTIHHSFVDSEAFNKIGNLNKDVSLEGEDKSNLIKAYNYFHEHLDVSKINHLHILTNISFFNLYLDEKDNEYQIFDTINSLGMRLTTEELLKNYLYTKADLKDYEKDWKKTFEDNQDLISYWKSERALGRFAKKNISEWFFHTLLQILMLEPQNNISPNERAEFRKYDDENEFSYFQKIVEKGNWKKVDFAKEVCSYASIL